MITSPKEYSQIFDTLKLNPRGMSLKQISTAVGMNRISVARYLDVLRTTGQVEMVPYGQTKLFYLSKSAPVSALLDFSSDYVILLSPDYRIVQINKRFVEFFEYTMDELIGKPLGSVFYSIAEDIPIEKMIEQALSGQTIDREIRILKEEEEYYFKIKIVPTVFYDGSPGTTMIFNDITEYKRSIAALTESQEKYLSLIEKISELLESIETAASLNDNIRNPLQAIVGLAEIGGGEDVSKIQNLVEEIDEIVQELDIGWVESTNLRQIITKAHQYLDAQE
ncbi:MAG TPA: PAS domain-containing protein [Methanoculleus sp.]|nr:PAS domain-containing protein [Methanoculleus sp.]